MRQSSPYAFVTLCFLFLANRCVIAEETAVEVHEPRAVTQCFVGIFILTPPYLNGGIIPCTGACVNMTGTYGTSQVQMSIYMCDPVAICDILNITDKCSRGFGDGQINGCCCTTTDVCNYNYERPTVPPSQSPHDEEVTCFEGIATGGQIFGRDTICKGDCASLTFTGPTGSMNISTTFYMCDPALVCDNLQLHNNCSADLSIIPINGISKSGCCCDQDYCNNPTFPTPKPNLRCYVGLTIGSNYSNGADMQCDGRCANVSMMVGTGTIMNLYMCDPLELCRRLGIGFAGLGCT